MISDTLKYDIFTNLYDTYKCITIIKIISIHFDSYILFHLQIIKFNFYCYDLIILVFCQYAYYQEIIIVTNKNYCYHASRNIVKMEK